METKIFHSVNTGLYFWGSGTGLLVDGLFQGAASGFSDLPEKILRDIDQQAGGFAHLDGLLFTHLHPDHYDPALVREVRSPQRIPVCGPMIDDPEDLLHPIDEKASCLDISHAHIIALATVHDGPQFSDVPHRSYLIDYGNESFFIAGDAILRKEDADVLVKMHGKPVTAAFVNLYQAASQSGREFLRHLKPGRVCLCHLPFREDDHGHYWQIAGHLEERFPADLPVLEQLAQMSWMDEEKPEWI